MTRRELAELGLENLVGSEALKAYMHGYFVDNKLYQRAKAVANPSLYEDYRKQQARKKQQEKQEKRITLNSKRPAVNAELAERLFQENEEARQAMVRQGVLREIAGRFSALIRFQPLDAAARLAIAVKQIISLGQEFGLRIIQVDPATVRALSPEREALSVRSMTGVLEGVLTPVFAQAALNSRGAFRLTGLPGSLRLIPAYPATSSTVPVSVSSL